MEYLGFWLVFKMALGATFGICTALVTLAFIVGFLREYVKPDEEEADRKAEAAVDDAFGDIPADEPEPDYEVINALRDQRNPGYIKGAPYRD